MDGPRRRVSDHDRDYFRRLGEWERENDEIATAAHLALPMLERLNVSWRMYQELGASLHPDDDDGAAEAFYARAKERGLYWREEFGTSEGIDNTLPNGG